MASSTDANLEHVKSFSFILVVVIVAISFVVVVLMCSCVHNASSYDTMYRIGDQVFRRDFKKTMGEIGPELNKRGQEWLTPVNWERYKELRDVCDRMIKEDERLVAEE